MTSGDAAPRCRLPCWPLVALALVAACRSGEDTPPSGRAASEIAAAWERALAAVPPPARTSRAPLGRAAIEHLRAARQVIAQGAAPAGAWRWPEVRRVVLEQTAYEVGPGDEIVALSGIAYDPALDEIVVQPDRLLSYSAPELAHLLVHEASHAVYQAGALAASGMNRRQMDALLRSCREVSVAFRIAAEVIAYTNQAAWIEAQPSSAALRMTPPSEQLTAAVRATRGGAADERAFLALVRDNAERMEPAESAPPPCLPRPVVLQGPHRGAPLDPWSAAPEFSAARTTLDSLGGGGR